MSSNSRKSGRVTLQDVANKVGVTKITVSRAIRTPEKVSESLRLTIHKAIDKMGYVPNRAASMLSAKQSKTIVLIVPSLSNGVFADVVRGINDVMLSQGFQILLGHSGYSLLEEERLIETYLQFGIDGIIISGTHHTERSNRLLRKSNLPVVEIMECNENAIDMSVGLDHAQAGYKMTQHLIGKGYKNIGFAGARMDLRAQLRLDGWRKAIWETELSDARVLTSSYASTYQMGADMLTEILGEWPDTDCIFFCNDDLAAGALFECQRRNLKVPKDIALVGFNDLDICSATNPKLTSVCIPRFDIGEQAAKLLLKRINDEPIENKHLDLGFIISERAST